MTWVKLCGMTRRRDVEAAAEAGADAVGFVIAEESKRRITPAEARRLGEGIPVARYLVSVGLTPADLLRAAEQAGVDGVQPGGEHAREAAGAALEEGLAVLFPIRVSGPPDLSVVPDGGVPLLDAAVSGFHGGTGRSFDWNLATGLDADFVLAGGLNPDNVAGAVRATGAWGADVSSGIESSPGVKDPQAMRRFVEALR